MGRNPYTRRETGRLKPESIAFKGKNHVDAKHSSLRAECPDPIFGGIHELSRRARFSFDPL
jgi:hypothetical protein